MLGDVTGSVINDMRYSGQVIKSFADRDTQRAWDRKYISRWSRPLQVQARLRLVMIDSAAKLEDLRQPPGNRLELLRGNRAGHHSIRVNAQWRICFKWNDGAEDVELVDCH